MEETAEGAGGGVWWCVGTLFVFILFLFASFFARSRDRGGDEEKVVRRVGSGSVVVVDGWTSANYSHRSTSDFYAFVYVVFLGYSRSAPL